MRILMWLAVQSVGRGPEELAELALGLVLVDELARSRRSRCRRGRRAGWSTTSRRSCAVAVVYGFMPSFSMSCGTWMRHGAVVGQRVVEADERLVQRLVDQQAAESGAVDEEIGGERRRCPWFARRAMEPCSSSATSTTSSTIRLTPAVRGVALQVLGELGGVEVVAVGVLDLVPGDDRVGRRASRRRSTPGPSSSKTVPSRKRGERIASHDVRGDEAGIVERLARCAASATTRRRSIPSAVS